MKNYCRRRSGAKWILLLSSLLLLGAGGSRRGSILVKGEPGVKVYIYKKFVGITDKKRGELLLKNLSPRKYRLKFVKDEWRRAVWVRVKAYKKTEVEISFPGAKARAELREMRKKMEELEGKLNSLQGIVEGMKKRAEKRYLLEKKILQKLIQKVSEIERKFPKLNSGFERELHRLKKKLKAVSPKGVYWSSGTSFSVPILPGASVVYISWGTFEMGSPNEELERDYRETRHLVKLTRGFFIWSTEVTQGQFKAVMGYNPSYFSECGDECPVENVTWHRAAAFANALSKKMGLERCFSCDGGRLYITCKVKKKFRGKNYYSCPGWRLPTEAEWEYAYRAGTKTPFYTGRCISTAQANFDGKSETYGKCPKGISRKKTLPVKSFRPNGWGLYDMAGNVSEWVVDSKESYSKNLAVDPIHLNQWKIDAVVRGGSWDDGPAKVRAAFRGEASKSRSLRYIGFRIVRTNLQ